MTAPLILAFDIGGTRIKAGVVCGEQVLAAQIVPTNEAGNIATIVALGQQLRQHYSIHAVGLCIRGIVDGAKGRIVSVNGPLQQLTDQPLADIIAGELALPTILDNDARMYALGEYQCGAGQGLQNVVCLTLGTGVGTGVISEGRLLRGARGMLGILGGHISVDMAGEPCTCGNIGCLETVASASALVRATQMAIAQGGQTTLTAATLDPAHIFTAAANGDHLAHTIVDRFVSALAIGIVSLIHVYDPDIVVVGGGMAHAAPLFLPNVQQHVARHAWTIPPGRVSVVPARFGDTAALLGVAFLATTTFPYHPSTEEAS